MWYQKDFEMKFYGNLYLNQIFEISKVNLDNVFYGAIFWKTFWYP